MTNWQLSRSCGRSFHAKSPFHFRHRVRHRPTTILVSRPSPVKNEAPIATVSRAATCPFYSTASLGSRTSQLVLFPLLAIAVSGTIPSLGRLVLYKLPPLLVLHCPRDQSTAVPTQWAASSLGMSHFLVALRPTSNFLMHQLTGSLFLCAIRMNAR